MIAYIDGVLAEKSPSETIIDVQGVGYQLQIPASTYERLGKPGERVKLLTYQHVREDTLQLFGFFDKKEKWMFQKLISVSGVGPKLALGILSGSNVDDLVDFITNEVIDRLTELSGVGKKTAQRMSLELKDKLGVESGGISGVASHLPDSERSKIEEGVLGLVSLGFPRSDAERSIAKILAEERDLPVDELIRRSLQK